MAVDEIIRAFEKEFEPIRDKFVILKLLDGKRNLDIDELRTLDILEDGKKDMIWHPGAYLFFGHGKPYRVGRHLENSRFRILQHLKDRTSNGTDCVWDIDNAPDKEIVLFNIKKVDNYHWVAAAEIYLENYCKTKNLMIPSARQG